MADKKISQLTAYTTPLDADLVAVVDTANTTTKKTTWANVKATLKTYFDTLYTTSAAVTAALASYATTASLSAYATLTGAQTITNKRNTRRVVTVTQAATPTYNTDNGDSFTITGLAQAITSMTTNATGTPVAGDVIVFDITDNGTARAITWGANFESSSTVTLPTTTVISTMMTVIFRWNAATSKWRCVSVI